MTAEMKKEFELYLLSDDCGWCDGKEWQMGTLEINNLWNWFESKLKSEIAEACKKAKIEELGKFLVIVSGATNILDRMQTIEVLHNRIMELDKPPSLEPKSPSPKESE